MNIKKCTTRWTSLRDILGANVSSLQLDGGLGQGDCDGEVEEHAQHRLGHSLRDDLVHVDGHGR